MNINNEDILVFAIVEKLCVCSCCCFVDQWSRKGKKYWGGGQIEKV